MMLSLIPAFSGDSDISTFWIKELQAYLKVVTSRCQTNEMKMKIKIKIKTNNLLSLSTDVSIMAMLFPVPVQFCTYS
jgi:hypothetical protein